MTIEQMCGFVDWIVHIALCLTILGWAMAYLRCRNELKREKKRANVWRNSSISSNAALKSEIKALKSLYFDRNHLK